MRLFIYILSLIFCIVAPWWLTFLVVALTTLRHRSWETLTVAFLFDSLYTPYSTPVATIIILIMLWALEPVRERIL